jgi:hypothetical protein
MVSGLATGSVHATTVSIEEAVDNLDLTWTTGGNVAWSGQTTVYYYDGDSAQSGKISHSQNSWLSTTIDAGTSGKYLSFFWFYHQQIIPHVGLHLFFQPDIL